VCACEKLRRDRGGRDTVCVREQQGLRRDGVRAGAARRRTGAAAGGPGPATLLHAAHAGHHRRQTHRQGELHYNHFYLANYVNSKLNSRIRDVLISRQSRTIWIYSCGYFLRL
jgi:hypothetical protein